MQYDQKQSTLDQYESFGKQSARMPKSNETDRALISALKENARLTVSELAYKIGVSRTTIKTRLDRLVDRGTITGFTIETDIDQDDSLRAIMMVRLQGKVSSSIVAALQKVPEVTKIFSTNGHWDLLLEIRACTLSRFERVMGEVRDVEGILNTETRMLLRQLS